MSLFSLFRSVLQWIMALFQSSPTSPMTLSPTSAPMMMMMTPSPISVAPVVAPTSGMPTVAPVAPVVAGQPTVRGPLSDVTSDSKFIVYYGDDFYTNSEQTDSSFWQLNPAVMDELSQFDVVVLNPGQPHCTPEVIDTLQTAGVQYVIGYISVGEDFIDDSFENPLTGTGMVRYVDNVLVPDPDNTLASFYVDVDTQDVIYDENGRVVSVTTSALLTPDGIPDYNPLFLGYMVNPDANWRSVLHEMRIGGSPTVPGRTRTAGLRQLVESRSSTPTSPEMLRDRTTNFGCDGFFLDTLDTAGPYDGAGWYPWTLEAMRDTVKDISDSYPDKVVFANRGAFFFSAGLQSPVTGQYPIDFTIRPYIDAFLFESFRYDSEPGVDGDGGVSEFYVQNRYNVAPKIFAEANRADGFTMFSLEYESGRASTVADTLDIDIRTFGFVAHVCENGDLTTLDTDVRNLLPDSQNDAQAPQWDNTGVVLYNIPATATRVGVQQVVMGDSIEQALVRWDIAIDQSYAVTYDIVVTNLGTNTAETLESVLFATNPDWLYDPANHAANQFTINGLLFGSTYNVKVVAKDALGNRNTEDTGFIYAAVDVVTNPLLDGDIVFDGLLDDWAQLLSYPPDPDDVSGLSTTSNTLVGAGLQANWRQIQVAHTTDTENLYLAYTNETPIYLGWGFQIFIDTDEDSTTGFNGSYGGITQMPIGADYLIEGPNIYQYDGDGDSFEWIVAPATEGFQVGRISIESTMEIFFPSRWIGSPSSMRFVAFGNNQFYTEDDVMEVDWYPDRALAGDSFRYVF